MLDGMITLHIVQGQRHIVQRCINHRILLFLNNQVSKCPVLRLIRLICPQRRIPDCSGFSYKVGPTRE